jgi:hypothetical protein
VAAFFEQAGKRCAPAASANYCGLHGMDLLKSHAWMRRKLTAKYAQFIEPVFTVREQPSDIRAMRVDQE